MTVMDRKSKSRIVLTLKAILTGSLVLSRSTAGAATYTEPVIAPDAWDQIASSYLLSQRVQILPESIVAMVLDGATSGNLAIGVAMSYLMVDNDQVAALDTLWTDTLLQSGNPQMLQAFLQIRAESLPSTLNTYGDGEARIWLAHHQPGHYDCGGGNGGNESTPGCDD